MDRGAIAIWEPVVACPTSSIDMMVVDDRRMNAE